MSDSQSKKRDLSLPFMAMVILATLTLSACGEASVEDSDGDASSHSSIGGESIMVDDDMDDTESNLEMGDDGVVSVEDEPVEVALEDDQVEVEVDLDELAEPAVASYTIGELQPYSAELFAQAIEDGNDVFVDVYADWCPVCRGNADKVEAAIGENSDIVAFQVDFDNDVDFLKNNGVAMQSTYIFFEEGVETDRVSGPQTEESLLALISG